jgi:ribose transport system substrate-binding protein
MKMKKSKTLCAILAVLFVAALIAGCGGDKPAESPSTSQSVPPSASAPSTQAQQTSLEKLLAMENKRPLGGLQPAHLDSRASIKKALPVTDDGHITIAWASASQASSFFTEMLRSARERCAQYGYDFTYQVAANFSLDEQITHIENFLTQDIDFLVVNAIDIDATLNFYNQAVAQGVPVIVVGPTAAKPEYPLVTTVLSGSFESGFVVGEYVAEKLYKDYNGKELQVGFVFSRTDDADSNSRPCGFVSGYLNKQAALNGKPYASRWDATLEAYNYWTSCINSGSSTIPGIMNLLGYEPAGATDANSGQRASEQLLTRFSNMDLLFADTDSLSAGVLQAVVERGLTPGEDILIATGADAADYCLLNIIDGKILATGTNAPYYTGESVVDLIHSIYNGFDANNLPANSYTPTYCVNVDNVNEYYNPDLKFAPALPWTVETIDEYNIRNANS